MSAMAKTKAPNIISFKGISGTTPWIMYKLRPNGGVIKAISIVINKSIPNQIGENPNAVIIGYIIGIDITIIPIASINRPIMINIIIIIIIITCLLRSASRSIVTKFWGIK